MRKGLLRAGICLSLMLLPFADNAYAYTFLETCNGCPTTIEITESLRQNTYSIPVGSARESDLINAHNEWNTGITSWSPLVRSGTTSDTVVTHGDGQWETAVVPRSSINGDNGLTYVEFSACFIGCNSIVEADPKIASDLFFGNPDESGWDVAVGGALSARDVYLHEWGHAIGLDHQLGFDLMISGGLKPRGGGTGSHSSPMGDDRKGAAALYGSFGTYKNLVASGLRFATSSNTVTTTTYVGTIYTSGSTQVTMRASLVNNGTQNLSFDWRTHVNTCPTCYSGGINWSNWYGATVNNRNQVLAEQVVYPPFGSMACNTTYYTFHTVDSGSAQSENREFDNSSHHALTIHKVCI